MLKYLVKHSVGEPFQISRTPRGTSVWVDGHAITDADIATVTSQYSLNRNILLDVNDAEELPRVDFVDGVLYVFVRIPRLAKSGGITTSPMVMAVQPHALVTLAHSAVDIPQKIIDAELPVRTTNTNELFLAVLAAVINQYEGLVRQTAHNIRTIQSRLRTHEARNSDFVQFVSIEDNLHQFRMNLDSMHEITLRLHANKRGLFSDDDVEALEDAMLHIKQLSVATSNHGQTVTSIRNAYSTVTSNTLNQRMKLLTVLTLLVALPNVFYGMYGMNVSLPFENEPWAYAAIVTFTAILILCVYLLVRRLKVF